MRFKGKVPSQPVLGFCLLYFSVLFQPPRLRLFCRYSGFCLGTQCFSTRLEFQNKITLPRKPGVRSYVVKSDSCEVFVDGLRNRQYNRVKT